MHKLSGRICTSYLQQNVRAICTVFFLIYILLWNISKLIKFVVAQYIHTYIGFKAIMIHIAAFF